MRNSTMTVKTYEIKSVNVDIVLQIEVEDAGGTEFFYDLFVEGDCINEGLPIFIDASTVAEAVELCPSKSWVEEFYSEVIDEIGASRS